MSSEIPFDEVEGFDEVKQARKNKSKKKSDNADLRLELNHRMRELNETYAIVQRGSQMLVMREGFDVDGQPTLSYMSTRDFGIRIAHNRIWDAEGEKFVSVAGNWLTWSDRREYDEIYFRPDMNPRERYYNLWKGFKVVPKKGQGKFNIFIDHIQSNICQNDATAFEWVMSWLADIFQNPGKKPGTALVLRGEMGIGKGAFANHIGHLLGNHYCTVANGSQVTGRFNSHLAERIMIFVDESFWSSEKNGAGILRALITEPRQASEMKGRDLIMVDSYLRLIIAANDDWAVPVGMADERRVTVLDVGKGVQQNKEYFKEMAEQLNDGGYEALLYYFLNYKYDPIIPSRILKTHALLDQKLYSMPHEAKWWYDCLKQGSIKIGDGLWPVDSIRVDDFYAAYSDWADMVKVKNKMSKNALSRALKKWVQLEHKKIYVEGWSYLIGELASCKEQFEAAIGHFIDWGKEENLYGN